MNQALKAGLCPGCGKPHSMSTSEIEAAVVDSLAEYGPDSLDCIVCDDCFLHEICVGDAAYFAQLLGRSPRTKQFSSSLHL